MYDVQPNLCGRIIWFAVSGFPDLTFSRVEFIESGDLRALVRSANPSNGTLMP